MKRISLIPTSRLGGIGTALTLSLLLVLTASSQQERTKRWELEFTNDPPKVYTYVSPMDEKSNYWYLIYTITNNTPDNIRLAIDVCIKADTGEYYQDMIHPIIEDGMIAVEEKLIGLGIGIQKTRIKELKVELKYLNCSELRAKNEIKAGETIKCIATFEEINRLANELEVMVGGLVDVVKRRYDPPPERDPDWNRPMEDRLLYEYEVRIWKMAYHLPGDEFYDQTKPIRKGKKEWLIRNYGPVGSLKTLEALIEGLNEDLPTLRWTAWWLLLKLTGHEFNYNPAKSPYANKKSITRWREWFYRNKGRLVYNLPLNRFEIRGPRW